MFVACTDDGTLTTSTIEVQNSMLFFNSTDVKCQHCNPIVAGIFRGCHVSILKKEEVIYRSRFEQLLTLYVPHHWLRSSLLLHEPQSLVKL